MEEIVPGDLATALISKADDVVIVSPYIKLAALERLLGDVRRYVRLSCVTRWTPEDVIAGASDVECRESVVGRGGKFSIHSSLHAKYYRFDDRVLVGSANLTMAGFGWAAASNVEILCGPSSEFDAVAFENNILGKAVEMSDEEFQYWASVEQLRGNIDQRQDLTEPLLDWIPLARDLTNVRLNYFGSSPQIASSDERVLAERDLASLAVPPGLSHRQFNAWVVTRLLSADFVRAVLRMRSSLSQDAARSLALEFGLTVRSARRAMQTVHNWLRELAPELLPSSENE